MTDLSVFHSFGPWRLIFLVSWSFLGTILYFLDQQPFKSPFFVAWIYENHPYTIPVYVSVVPFLSLWSLATAKSPYTKHRMLKFKLSLYTVGYSLSVFISFLWLWQCASKRYAGEIRIWQWKSWIEISLLVCLGVVFALGLADDLEEIWRVGREERMCVDTGESAWYLGRKYSRNIVGDLESQGFY
jgi:hypothetical protein